jgi:hypothetical protein
MYEPGYDGKLEGAAQGLNKLRACLKMWCKLPACLFKGRPRPVFLAAGCRPNRQTRCLPHIFRQALKKSLRVLLPISACYVRSMLEFVK